MKKILEVTAYLLIELALAYLLVSELNLDSRILPIIGTVFIWIGKLIVVKTKGE